MSKCTAIILALAFHLIPAAAQEQFRVDGYAASVNGDIITVSDVLKFVAIQPQPGLSPEEQQQRLDQEYARGLEALIDRKLIMLEFADNEGQVPPQMIREKMEEIIEVQFDGNRAALLEALNHDRMTLEEWKQQLRESMVVKILRREHVDDRIFVPPNAIKDLYLQRLEAFRQKAEVHLRVIIINKDDTEYAEKQVEAAALHRLAIRGSDFARLASSHSEGFNAEQGGDLGWVESKDLREELKPIIARMQPGQISDVIDMGEAYWILKLEQRKEDGLAPLEQVQPQLETELRAAQEAQLYAEWMERLRNKYPITLFDDATSP